jgi:acyl-CoA thioester hydrolase
MVGDTTRAGGADPDAHEVRRYRRRVRLSVDPSIAIDDYEYVHRIRVRFVETDAMGIVHHSNYLAYFEETRVAYLRHIGHPFTEWREAGLESPVLESFVQYRRPLEFDDEIDVRLRLAEVTRATFQMAYLITVDDADRVAQPRATGVTVHGCVTQGGRPTRLPAWLTALAPSSPPPTR